MIDFVIIVIALLSLLSFCYQFRKLGLGTRQELGTRQRWQIRVSQLVKDDEFWVCMRACVHVVGLGTRQV